MQKVESLPIHFCTDLHLVSKLITTERCVMLCPLPNQLRTKSEVAHVSVLATMFDVAASDPVLAAWHPDWTATQSITINSLKPIHNGPIIVDTKILRQGKRSISVSAYFYDGNGIDDLEKIEALLVNPDLNGQNITLAAKGIISFSRLSRVGISGVDDYDPNQWVSLVKTRSSGRTCKLNLEQRMDTTLLNEPHGVIEVHNSPYLANSNGTINGGSQAACIELAAQIMRPNLTVTDIQIHYLSQLKEGPARTRCTSIRDSKDHSVISVELLDHGNSDGLAAVANVILQPI